MGFENTRPFSRLVAFLNERSVKKCRLDDQSPGWSFNISDVVLKYVLVISGLLAVGVSAGSCFGQASDSASTGMYTAAYEFYGRTPYPLYSKGARIGYAPDAETEIHLSYIWSSQKILLSDFSYREGSLMLKKMLGSVIYWGAGLGIREVIIGSNVFLAKTNETDPGREVPIREEYQAISLNTGLGFEYALTNNFLIGSSLFSLSAPVHWLKKSSNFPEDADGLEEDPKEFPYLRDSLKTNFQILRTYVKVRL